VTDGLRVIRRRKGKLLRPKRIEGRDILAPRCALHAAIHDAGRHAAASRYLLSAPPAKGCVAVFADAMTESTFGSFFMARAMDSFVA